MGNQACKNGKMQGDFQDDLGLAKRRRNERAANDDEFVFIDKPSEKNSYVMNNKDDDMGFDDNDMGFDEDAQAKAEEYKNFFD